MNSLPSSAFGLAQDLASPALRVFGLARRRRAGGRPDRTHLEVRGAHLADDGGLRPGPGLDRLTALVEP